MPRPADGLLDDARDAGAQLRADVTAALDVRWRLVRLELGTALLALRRLSISMAIAAWLAASVLPVAAVLCAEALARVAELERIAALAIVGGAMLLLAGLIAAVVWWLFRRRWRGVEQTLEFLREDAEWLNHWLREDAPRD
ncbi:MAG: phage holin family protein [Pirellulales bacterium]|nr:phage holin family protein [Pirellulales bacterium]